MNASIPRACLVMALTLAGPAAFAQPTIATAEKGREGSGLWPPVERRETVVRRGYFSVNAGYQGTTSRFTSQWSSPYYLETESVSSSYSIRPGVLFEAGAGMRVWRDLALGVGVSRYHRADFASLAATLPHPLLFNQARSFKGTATGPARTEIAVHGQAMWMVPAGRKVSVGIFAGPTLFSVKQVAITEVDFAEVYPYATVTVANTSTGSQTKSKVGFNAGGDVAILLIRQIGIGILVRYAGTTIRFAAPEGETPPAKAGGLQVAAGLRVHF